MSGLLEARGLIFPSLPSFPDDHDVLSFLTFSLSEPGPEVMPALGLPCGKGLGRGTSPDVSAYVMAPSDLPFQLLSLPALWALLKPGLGLEAEVTQN